MGSNPIRTTTLTLTFMKCTYCGSSNKQAYKGMCPNCPEDAMELHYAKKALTVREMLDFLQTQINEGRGDWEVMGTTRTYDVGTFFKSPVNYSYPYVYLGVYDREILTKA